MWGNLIHAGHNFVVTLCADPVQYFESISYVGVFILSGLSGHLLPIPEDVIMLLSGYIAAIGLVQLSRVIVVAFVAVLTADLALYYLSFSGAHIIEKATSKIKTNVFTWFVDRMKSHTFRVVFISRFVPGLRFLGPVTAGYIRVKPLRFFLYSLCSSVIYVPCMITIGFIFHTKISPLLGVVETTSHTIFALVLVALTIGISVSVYRRFFKRAAA